MKILSALAVIAGLFASLASFTSFAAMLPPGTAFAEETGGAGEKIRGEVLLTVAPCPPDWEMDEYLDDIAAAANAYVANTYTALAMTEDDPILLLIRSETEESDAMAAALADDERVYSATPSQTRTILLNLESKK